MAVRIGLARLALETNSFNPVPTTLDDVTAVHLLDAEALVRGLARGATEVPGLMRRAELAGAAEGVRSAGAEPVPLFSAWGIPGGPLEDRALAALEALLHAALDRAGPLDGLVIALHGAMATPTDPYAEAGLLERLRERLGARPLVATFDLHVHLTPRKVAPLTAFFAYRTNPHRDHAAVGFAAGRCAAQVVARGLRPVVAWRSLPMIGGGGTTLDVMPTMMPVFLRARAATLRRGVAWASVHMSHLWHDAPDLGWSTAAVTDGDRDLAERVAEELAEALWAVRDVGPPPMWTIGDALAEIGRRPFRRRFGCFCVSDLSDNVAAGGTGENTVLLRAVLEHDGGLRVLVPFRDAVAVAALADVPIGGSMRVTVGGRLHPNLSPELQVTGRVVHRSAHPAFGHRVVLELDGSGGGKVALVLCERAPLAMTPGFFRDVGLEPRDADVVVVKSIFHFRWYFLGISQGTYVVTSSGTTDLDLASKLPFRFPVYGRDPIADWRVEDRRRRGIPG